MAWWSGVLRRSSSACRSAGARAQLLGPSIACGRSVLLHVDRGVAEREYRSRHHPDPPLRQEILDVSKAQTEPVVEPNGMADDLRWKPVATVAGCAVVHLRTLPAI